MGNPTGPARVGALLQQLNRDHKFEATAIVRGRMWRWLSASGVPLTVNLPVTVHVIFAEDNKSAHLSNYSAYFSAAYAAHLLDTAKAINAGALPPGAQSIRSGISFKVVQEPGNTPSRGDC